MEVLQASQWLVGVDSNLNSSCAKANTYVTVVAYTHLHLQPLLYASFPTKNDNRFAWYMGLYTFVVAMINFIVGFYVKASGIESMSLNEDTNYGLRTCTYHGKDNHLVWKFAIASFQYQPTPFVWFAIISLVIVLHYDRIFQSTIGVAFCLTAVYSAWAMGGINAEFSAHWCLITALGSIPMAIYAKLYGKNKNKQN